VFPPLFSFFPPYIFGFVLFVFGLVLVWFGLVWFGARNIHTQNYKAICVIQYNLLSCLNIFWQL